METSWRAGGNRMNRHLIDDFLPEFDVRERHSTTVHASAERVYEALWSVDFAESHVIRLLLAIRALPALVLTALREPAATRRRLRARRDASLTLRDVVAGGFAVLAASPPRELVLGVVGAFWRLRADRRPADPATFRDHAPAGTARAAWDFRVTERAGPVCVLSTETRVRCSDAASRRRFRLYWIVVRPGSGLIRRAMLSAVRRAAEA